MISCYIHVVYVTNFIVSIVPADELESVAKRVAEVPHTVNDSFGHHNLSLEGNKVNKVFRCEFVIVHMYLWCTPLVGPSTPSIQLGGEGRLQTKNLP